MIPYGHQEISDQDIDSVVEVLRSDFLTQGPKIHEFEEALSAEVNAKHSIAVNSATSALHLACRVLNLSKGDWLWTTPNSFVASANCGLYCGASIDFVDIDCTTYNMSPNLLYQKLLEAKKRQMLPKIVVPVHFAGQPCDMTSIKKLSIDFGFQIIEDASHALGATWEDNLVGSCSHSAMTIFSFHPVKMITTGEGGAVTTNSPELADKLRVLRSHGITRQIDKLTKINQGEWYYEQQDLGYNYRMTDLEAALGLSQIKRLKEFIFNRRKIANRYIEELKEESIHLPIQDSRGSSSFHLFPILIPNQHREKRRLVFDALRKAGIGVNVHYIPIHMQPIYSSIGFKEGDFPNAECYYESTISLPIYSALTYEDQSYIISNLKKILRQNKI